MRAFFLFTTVDDSLKHNCVSYCTCSAADWRSSSNQVTRSLTSSWSLFQSVAMGLLSIVEKVYPRARWPTGTQIRGYGAWGGVLAATAIYVVQPWDWLEETLGMKKQEAAH